MFDFRWSFSFKVRSVFQMFFENMFELWNMIDYGSQFEQNLQYKLYKQLDKDK